MSVLMDTDMNIYSTDTETEAETDTWISLAASTRNLALFLRIRNSGISGKESDAASCKRGAEFTGAGGLPCTGSGFELSRRPGNVGRSAKEFECVTAAASAPVMGVGDAAVTFASVGGASPDATEKAAAADNTGAAGAKPRPSAAAFASPLGIKPGDGGEFVRVMATPMPAARRPCRPTPQ